MEPHYDLDKIKFATDRPTFERAVKLYESGKVTKFTAAEFGFSASVIGSESSPYEVYVSAKHYDEGTCTCYLGQNDTLCKHMVAVALYAVIGGRKLSAEEKEHVKEPVCSGRRGSLNGEELKVTKGAISAAMRYIKPYEGPSRIWFAYQDSLIEGCNRLTKIVSDLPVSQQTSKLLVNLLLRLDKKLSHGGVDDSDGTVGGFIESVVEVLKEYAKIEPNCLSTFELLKDRETCFGWEESLVELLDH